MNVLVVDVGGSNVKFLATGQEEPRKFKSGPELTPQVMADRVKAESADWGYDGVALGIPAKVGRHGPEGEPGNLGDGWIHFDYSLAFGKEVRVINDAAMQALGAYTGGRMLFLGLGTGLGSALVVDRVVVPLELGCLPHKSGDTLADRVGKKGLAEHGEVAWQKAVRKMVDNLREAFAADHVVLGGGNAKLVDPLPEHTVRGGNADAFTGGFRLWDEKIEHHDVRPSHVWRVVR